MPSNRGRLLQPRVRSRLVTDGGVKMIKWMYCKCGYVSENEVLKMVGSM